LKAKITILNPERERKEDKKKKKDSRRLEAKRKLWGRSERHFISGRGERERASYC
jgi:hypothetical protein